MVEVILGHPESPEGQQLLAALSKTLLQLTGSSGTTSFQAGDIQCDGACFAIARTPDGIPVGCGAIRPLQPGVAELKRMFALPGTQGVGSAVLAFLERKACEYGYAQLWLETRQVNQRAIAFYLRHGYQTIPNFGSYVGRAEAVCFGKPLTAAQALA